MERYLDFLLTMPLFSGMEREELLRLLHCCNAQLIEAGAQELLWLSRHPGSVGYLMIVLEGKLTVFREDLQGNRLLMGPMAKGQFFNDYALPLLQQLPFIAEAQEESIFLRIENERLLYPCAKKLSISLGTYP